MRTTNFFIGRAANLIVQKSPLVGSLIFSGNSTKAVNNEAPNKKLHGIFKDVPIDFPKLVIEKDLRNDTEFKRNQRSSHPVPVLELLFRSEAGYDIAIDSRRNIAKKHFKINRKSIKLK